MSISPALLPPKHYRRFAYHHWIEGVDTDGRSTGAVVYQWQPQAGKWCKPNQYACGLDIELTTDKHHYVDLCPMPAFKVDQDKFRTILDKLRDSDAYRSLPEDERDHFSLLVFEHVLTKRD